MKELNVNDLNQVSGGIRDTYLTECIRCGKRNVTMCKGEDKIPICNDCLAEEHANNYKTDPIV